MDYIAHASLDRIGNILISLSLLFGYICKEAGSWGIFMHTALSAPAISVTRISTVVYVQQLHNVEETYSGLRWLRLNACSAFHVHILIFFFFFSSHQEKVSCLATKQGHCPRHTGGITTELGILLLRFHSWLFSLLFFFFLSQSRSTDAKVLLCHRRGWGKIKGKEVAVGDFPFKQHP